MDNLETARQYLVWLVVLSIVHQNLCEYYSETSPLSCNTLPLLNKTLTCVVSPVNYEVVRGFPNCTDTGGNYYSNEDLRILVAPLTSKTICCYEDVSVCDAAVLRNNKIMSPDCPDGDFQIAPPSTGNFRHCKAGQCEADQYLVAAPAVAEVGDSYNFTGFGVCANLDICDDHNFQTQAPLCVSTAEAFYYLQEENNGSHPTNFSTMSLFPNPVSCNLSTAARYPLTNDSVYIRNRECRPFTICKDTEYISIQPTYTTDLSCAPISPPCSSGEQQIVAPVPQKTNRVCIRKSSQQEKLSAGDDVGITLGVLLSIGLFCVILAYKLKRVKNIHQMEKMEFELQERLLGEELERMRKGWQIAEEQIKLVSAVAEGSYGTVWRGKWGHMDVAVKKLHAGVAELSPDSVREFQDEAIRMQSIRHPNLVTFYGAGSDHTGEPFLVFEMMGLGSLRGLLMGNQELSWEMRLLFAIEIASGMDHLHRIQLIHRDLKTDNVLVGDDMHAKIADFGQSRLLQNWERSPSVSSYAGSALTARMKFKSMKSNGKSNKGRDSSSDGFSVHSSSVMASLSTAVGTPLYSAPEILMESKDYGPSIDVFSFAIVMWELHTRKPPWNQITAKSFFEFNRKLEQAVLSGQRPLIPEGCNETYAQIMEECWHSTPDLRPKFDEIFRKLNELADSHKF